LDSIIVYALNLRSVIHQGVWIGSVGRRPARKL